MDRRAFFRHTLIGASALALPALAPLGAALAQREGGAIEGREVADPSALTSAERRHLPLLRLPSQVRRGRSFDLVIQIGVEPHVMEAAHFIDRIELFADRERIFESDLSPRLSFPILRLPLRLRQSVLFTARARCNLHGLWLTRAQVEVS